MKALLPVMIADFAGSIIQWLRNMAMYFRQLKGSCWGDADPEQEVLLVGIEGHSRTSR
jgi:hypothetical protein